MITENKDTETRCNKAVKQTEKKELEREEEQKIKTKDNENQIEREVVGGENEKGNDDVRRETGMRFDEMRGRKITV